MPPDGSGGGRRPAADLPGTHRLRRGRPRGHGPGCRARGLEFLQIPANYYEDLDARFGLDPEFLATLQELNLLYDRDADGEFLHFYTATVGSVFFEMVERRGAYDGYGAPNAPVRHAVQYDHLHQLNRTDLTTANTNTPTKGGCCA